VRRVKAQLHVDQEAHNRTDHDQSKPQSTDQARRRGVGGLMSHQKRGSGRRGHGQRVMTEVWLPWWPQALSEAGPSTGIPGTLTPV